MARQKISGFKRWVFMLGLLLFPGLFALLCLELGLRFFVGKYQYAAESDYQASADRIWARNPNSKYQRKHPDTGVLHWVCHNNWALRQHRNFSEEQLGGALNVGIFGDSFVENLRVAAPFSFSESLDYLLNQTGHRANVLNFGVDGYGTDQSFLHYQDFPYAVELDQVYYLFTGNDLRNIYENNIFYLNEQGELAQREPAPSPWWVRFLANFHLTYFVIEAIQQIAFESEDANKQIDLNSFLAHSKSYKSSASKSIQNDYVAIQQNAELEAVMLVFWEILRQWRQEVEANGGSFHIVLIPRQAESRLLEFEEAHEFSIVPLAPYFARTRERLNYHQWRFVNDGHWNEFGNGLVAAHLFQHIHSSLYEISGLETGSQEKKPLQQMPGFFDPNDPDSISNEKLDRLLGTYYATFSQQWPGAPQHEPVNSELRAKYQALAELER